MQYQGSFSITSHNFNFIFVMNISTVRKRIHHTRYPLVVVIRISLSGKHNFSAVFIHMDAQITNVHGALSLNRCDDAVGELLQIGCIIG